MTRRVSRAIACAALLSAARGVTAQKAADGRSIFLAKCSTCHGRTGKPAPMYAKIGAANLSDPDWQKERSHEYIKNVVSNGSPGTAMRSFQNELEPAQIDAVVKFVRTLNAAPTK